MDKLSFKMESSNNNVPESEFMVLRSFSATELLPQMVVASVLFTVAAMLSLLMLSLLGTFQELSSALSKDGKIFVIIVTGWESLFFLIIIPILALLVVMTFLVLHEIVHYVVCRFIFGIPARFGAGLLEKMIPYLSVEPQRPVKRDQWIVIAVAPTILVNVSLLALITWTQTDLVWFFFFIVTYIVHFGGCAGDIVLLYHALKYQSSVYIKDEGPQITILIPKN